ARRAGRGVLSAPGEHPVVHPDGARAPGAAGRAVRQRGGGVSDRARRYLGFALALGVALALPRVLYPVLALDIVLWGLFAVAVDLLLGCGGLLSFGHAAFWGSAGYAAGVAARQAHLPFPLAVAAGVAVSVALAVPLGYLAVRRKGIYFAMVTLAFAQMVYYVANEWRAVTRGGNGLPGIPPARPRPPPPPP